MKETPRRRITVTSSLNEYPQISKKGDGERGGGSQLRDRDNFLLLLVSKSSFKLNGINLPMQLTDWLLVEVALQFFGLTKTS